MLMDGESKKQELRAWASMIPAESIRIVDLHLSPEENGISMQTKKEIEETPIVVPITMRKYLRYRLFLVS